MSLDMFFSRRGTATNIYSDGGTQFHSGTKELGRIFSLEGVKKQCASKWRTTFTVKPARFSSLGRKLSPPKDFPLKPLLPF
jgi:hypothetical protein